MVDRLAVPLGLTREQAVDYCKARFPVAAGEIKQRAASKGVAVFEHVADASFDTVNVFANRGALPKGRAGRADVAIVNGDEVTPFGAVTWNGGNLPNDDSMLPLMSSTGPRQPAGSVVRVTLTMPGYSQMQVAVRVF